MIVEILTSAAVGGAVTQLFRLLAQRRGAELTEQEQYRKAMADIVARYQQQLDEQAEHHRAQFEAAASAAAERLREQIARADAAELESERERSRRREAERERDAERERANGAQAREAELKVQFDRALVAIDALTRDISTLKRSTSGEHYVTKDPGASSES